jgi:hypothetical protein
MSDLDAYFSPPPEGLDPKKWARLSAFLGALTPGAAHRLFAALEAAQARGDRSLPTAPMLSVIRTRLFEAGAAFPARAKTAQRIFFTPFEDFFVSFRPGRKRRARIARGVIAPVWILLKEDPACAEAARAIADLDGAIARGGRELAREEEALFAAAAQGFARLIDHAEESEGYRGDLALRLGAGARDPAQAGAAALHDLAEMAQILTVRRHVTAMQAAFPRPAPPLTEGDLFEARQIYARAAADRQEAAAYPLLALAARMEAPWRAMRLSYHLAGAQDDRLPSAEQDAAVVAETLFEELEAAARRLEAAAEEDLDTEETEFALGHFADFANGMVEEAGRAGDGAASARIEAARDMAGEAFLRFVEQAQAALRKAQPVRHAGGSSRLSGLRPDIDRAIDRAAERAAREGALFLSRAGAHAVRITRPQLGAPILGEAAAETRRYANDLVLEIRAAEGADRASARRRMELTLDIGAPLIPAADLALLRERAAAAAVSA